MASKRTRKAESAHARATVREAYAFNGDLPPTTHPLPGGGTLTLEFADSLSGDRLDWAYHLLETNMRAMYERAWGWSDEQKRGELESPKARYIFAFLPQAPAAGAGAAGPARREAVGYVHYRFLEDARRPVAYVYEIQLGGAARGLGVGRALMEAVERVAAARRMAAVMLTVFADNAAALRFYAAVGYRPDVTSPQQPGAAYRILSKEAAIA